MMYYLHRLLLSHRPLADDPSRTGTSWAAYVVSANGAPSNLAWGNAPGNLGNTTKSAESAIHWSLESLHQPWRSQARKAESRLQPSCLCDFDPGALPQAFIESAPLALKTYWAGSRCHGVLEEFNNRQLEDARP